MPCDRCSNNPRQCQYGRCPLADLEFACDDMLGQGREIEPASLADQHAAFHASGRVLKLILVGVVLGLAVVALRGCTSIEVRNGVTYHKGDTSPCRANASACTVLKDGKQHIHYSTEGELVHEEQHLKCTPLRPDDCDLGHSEPPQQRVVLALNEFGRLDKQTLWCVEVMRPGRTLWAKGDFICRDRFGNYIKGI